MGWLCTSNVQDTIWEASWNVGLKSATSKEEWEIER